MVPADDGGDGETEWVLVLQSHDPVEHDMARRFLTDHGIEVQSAGGATHAIPTIGLTDMRVLVPKRDALRAEEILRALDRGATDAHPFRDGASVEPYEAPVERRKWPFAVVLAVVVPIGAGHFYARHGAAGVVLAIGIVGSTVAAMALHIPALMKAAMLMVALDMVLSPFAVRRFNAGKVPTEGAQRLGALAMVAVASVVAFVWGG